MDHIKWPKAILSCLLLLLLHPHGSSPCSPGHLIPFRSFGHFIPFGHHSPSHCPCLCSPAASVSKVVPPATSRVITLFLDRLPSDSRTARPTIPPHAQGCFTVTFSLLQVAISAAVLVILEYALKFPG